MNGKLGPFYWHATAFNYANQCRGQLWCDYAAAANAWGVNPYYVTKDYPKPPTETAVMIKDFTVKMD